MPEIKTRKAAEKNIKTLDKAAVIGERMKRAYIRTKETVRSEADTQQDSPKEYAENHIVQTVQDLSCEGVHAMTAAKQKAVQQGREVFRKKRAQAQKEKRQQQTHTPSVATNNAAQSAYTEATPPCPSTHFTAEQSETNDLLIGRRSRETR